MTTLAQFEQLKAAGYNTIPVYRQRLADTETPLSVFARFKDQTQAYLFESVEGGENWARYLGFFPALFFIVMVQRCHLKDTTSFSIFLLCILKVTSL